MRDAFFNELYKIAERDCNVILLSGDCGAPSLDKFRQNLPEQYINMGIAEQNMISVAAGLALRGKKVYCYAITSFLTMRCYDQIRIDICAMNLNVTLVGVGVGLSYDDAGDTHFALQDIALMRVLPNMTIWSPSNSGMAAEMAIQSYSRSEPQYIRLDRTKSEGEKVNCGLLGYHCVKLGHDVAIFSTGVMVDKAIKVSQSLTSQFKNIAVFDVFRLKPMDTKIIYKYKQIITLEEQYLSGGLGSIIAEMIVDSGTCHKLKRFGIPLKVNTNYGGREYLHKLAGLDIDTITDEILRWLE